MDFSYLAAQTFGDLELEAELLTLFLAQAADLLARLPESSACERMDAAHLLKGSARAIGAVRVADMAAAYERASSEGQPSASVAMVDLVAAFEETETAIRARLQRLATARA